MPGVKPPRVPEGLRDLMKSLTKEVLREKPPNIYEFSAQYFESILQEKKDFEFKGFEPITSYESIFKNRDRNQVPLSVVYAIIPEGLTELIKEFIKAVLRENPKNICEFAVEYFRKLHQHKNIDSSCSVQYAAYESYFKSNERFSFTPYVKCTCGRTFGEGMTHGHSYERQVAIISANNTGATTNEVSTQQNGRKEVLSNENNNFIQSKNIENNSGRNNVSTGTNNISGINNISTTDSLDYENEKYVNAIQILQRFFRRYLIKKAKDTNVVAAVGVNDSPQKQHTVMSEETAAFVIQRTVRKLFSEKFQKQLTTLKSTAAHRHENMLDNLELNDNISEAGSYTSASTALMSAESAAEGSEIGGFINYEEGTLQTASIALKDDNLPNEQINISKEKINKEKRDMHVNAISSESELHEKLFNIDIKDSPNKSTSEVDSTRDDALNNETVINKINIETSSNSKGISSEVNEVHAETFSIAHQSNDGRELEPISKTNLSSNAVLTPSIDTNLEKKIENYETDSSSENVTKRKSITEEIVIPVSVASNSAIPERDHGISNTDKSILDAQGGKNIGSNFESLSASADGNEIGSQIIHVTDITDQSRKVEKSQSEEIELYSETDGKPAENRPEAEKSTSTEIKEHLMEMKLENNEANLTLATVGEASDNVSNEKLLNDETEALDSKLNNNTFGTRQISHDAVTADNIADEVVNFSENNRTKNYHKSDNTPDVLGYKSVSLDINEVQNSTKAALQTNQTKSADDKLDGNISDIPSTGVNITTSEQPELAEGKSDEKLSDIHHEITKREVSDNETSENITDTSSVSDKVDNVLGASEHISNAASTNNEILSDIKAYNLSQDETPSFDRKISPATSLEKNFSDSKSFENVTQADGKSYDHASEVMPSAEQTGSLENKLRENIAVVAPLTHVADSAQREPNHTTDIKPTTEQTGLKGMLSHSTSGNLNNLDKDITPFTDQKALSGENNSQSAPTTEQTKSLDGKDEENISNINLTSDETGNKTIDDSTIISSTEHPKSLNNEQDDADIEPAIENEKTIKNKSSGNILATESKQSTDKFGLADKSAIDDVSEVNPSTDSLDYISNKTTVNNENSAQILPSGKIIENTSDLKLTSDEKDNIPESKNKTNDFNIISSTEQVGSLDNKLDKNTVDEKQPTNSAESKENISDLKPTSNPIGQIGLPTGADSNINTRASDLISSIEQQGGKLQEAITSVTSRTDRAESAKNMLDVNISDKTQYVDEANSSAIETAENISKVVDQAKTTQSDSTDDKPNDNNSDDYDENILNQVPPNHHISHTTPSTNSLSDLNISSSEQVASVEGIRNESGANHQIEKRAVTDGEISENIPEPDQVGHVYGSGEHTLETAPPADHERSTENKPDVRSANVTTLSNKKMNPKENISDIKTAKEKTQITDHKTTDRISDSKTDDPFSYAEPSINQLTTTSSKVDDHNADKADQKESSQLDVNSVLVSAIPTSDANTKLKERSSEITESTNGKTNDHVSNVSSLELTENPTGDHLTFDEESSVDQKQSSQSAVNILNANSPPDPSTSISEANRKDNNFSEIANSKTNEHVPKMSSLELVESTPGDNQTLDTNPVYQAGVAKGPLTKVDSIYHIDTTDNKQGKTLEVARNEKSKPDIINDMKISQELNEKESTLNENSNTKDASLESNGTLYKHTDAAAIAESNPVITDEKESISSKDIITDESNEDLTAQLLNKTYTISKSNSKSDPSKIAAEEEINHPGNSGELPHIKALDTEVTPKDDNDNNLKTDIGNLSSDSIIGTQNLHDSSNEVESSKKIVKTNTHNTNKKQKEIHKANNNKHNKISSEKLIPNPPIAEIYLKSFKLPPDALPWYDNSTTTDLNSTYTTKIAASEANVPKVKSEATQCDERIRKDSQLSGDDTEFSTDSLNDNYTQDSLELTSSKGTDIEEDSLEINQSKTVGEKERMATYLYGVHTPTTEARKVYKAPTAFIVPFGDNTSKISKDTGLKEFVDDVVPNDEINNNNLKKEHLNTSEELNTKEPALSLSLNKDDSIEGAPQLDSETPTKLFAELNDFDYTIYDTDTNAEDVKYSMDTTYSAEEILRLNSDILESELIELEDLYIDEPAPSSASMLQTIVELNESETPRPDEKLDSTNEPLDASESLSGSENESSWTCSKETDEPILSDEYMNENEIFESQINNNRRKISVAANTNEATQGGVYEMSPEKHTNFSTQEENSVPSPEPKFEDNLKEDKTVIVENNILKTAEPKSVKTLDEKETIIMKGNLAKSTESKSEDRQDVLFSQVPPNDHTSDLTLSTEQPPTEKIAEVNISSNDQVETSKPNEKVSYVTDGEAIGNSSNIKSGTDDIDESAKIGENTLGAIPSNDSKPEDHSPDVLPLSEQKTVTDGSKSVANPLPTDTKNTPLGYDLHHTNIVKIVADFVDYEKNYNREKHTVMKEPPFKPSESNSEEEPIIVKDDLLKSDESINEGRQGVLHHQAPLNYHVSHMTPLTEQPSTDSMSDVNISSIDHVNSAQSNTDKKISDVNHQIIKRAVTDNEINENNSDIQSGTDEVDHFSETSVQTLGAIPPNDSKPEDHSPDVLSEQKTVTDGSKSIANALATDTKHTQLEDDLHHTNMVKIVSDFIDYEKNYNGEDHTVMKEPPFKSSESKPEEEPIIVKDDLLKSNESINEGRQGVLHRQVPLNYHASRITPLLEQPSTDSKSDVINSSIDHVNSTESNKDKKKPDVNHQIKKRAVTDNEINENNTNIKSGNDEVDHLSETSVHTLDAVLPNDSKPDDTSPVTTTLSEQNNTHDTHGKEKAVIIKNASSDFKSEVHSDEGETVKSAELKSEENRSEKETVFKNDNLLESVKLNSEKLFNEEDNPTHKDTMLKSVKSKTNLRNDEEETIIDKDNFLKSKAEEYSDANKIVIVQDNPLKSVNSKSEGHSSDEESVVIKGNLLNPAMLELEENLDGNATVIVNDNFVKSLDSKYEGENLLKAKKHLDEEETIMVREKSLKLPETKTEEVKEKNISKTVVNMNDKGKSIGNILATDTQLEVNNKSKLDHDINIVKIVKDFIDYEKRYNKEEEPAIVKENLVKLTDSKSKEHLVGEEPTIVKENFLESAESKHEDLLDVLLQQVSPNTHASHIAPSPKQSSTDTMSDVNISSSDHFDSAAGNKDDNLSNVNHQIKIRAVTDEVGHVSENGEQMLSEAPPSDDKSKNHSPNLTLLSDKKTYHRPEENHSEEEIEIVKDTLLKSVEPKSEEHLDKKETATRKGMALKSAESKSEENISEYQTVIIKDNLLKSRDSKSQEHLAGGESAIIIENPLKEHFNDEKLTVKDKSIKLPEAEGKKIKDENKNITINNEDTSRGSNSTASAVSEDKPVENLSAGELKDIRKLEDNQDSKLVSDAEDNPFKSSNEYIKEELPYSERTVVVNFKFYPLNSPDLNSEERLTEEDTAILYRNVLESTDSKSNNNHDNEETEDMTAKLLKFPEEFEIKEETVIAKEKYLKSTESKPKTKESNEAETITLKKNLLKSPMSKTQESSYVEDGRIMNENLSKERDINITVASEKETLVEESNTHYALNESILEINQRLNDAEKLIEETVTEDTSLGFIEETIADLKDAHIQLSEFEMLISQAPTTFGHEPSEDEIERDLSVNVVDSAAFYRNVIIIENAATFIQKTYRGYLTRKQFKNGQHSQPKEARNDDNVKKPKDHIDTESLKTPSVEPSITKNHVEEISASIIQKAFKKYVDSKHKATEIQISEDKNNDNFHSVETNGELNKHGKQDLEVNILKKPQNETITESAISKKHAEEMAALIIQRAFKKYIENKSKSTDMKMSEDSSWDNSQSTVIYIGNDNNMNKIGEDAKSYASLDVISDLNSENEYSIIVHPEPSAPTVEELGSDHDNENSKVNWYVGNEPIVSTNLSDEEVQADLVNLLNVPETNAKSSSTNINDKPNIIVPDITDRAFESDMLQANNSDKKKFNNSKKINVNENVKDENNLKSRLIMDDKEISKESYNNVTAVPEGKLKIEEKINDSKLENGNEPKLRHVINVVKIVSDFIAYEKQYTDTERNVTISNRTTESIEVVDNDQTLIEVDKSTSEAHESSIKPSSININTNDVGSSDLNKNAIAPLIISDIKIPVENVMVATSTNNDSSKIKKLHSNDSSSLKESNNSVEIVSAVDKDIERVKDEEIIIKHIVHHENENIEKDLSHISSTAIAKSDAKKDWKDIKDTHETEGLQSDVTTDTEVFTASIDDQIVEDISMNQRENEPITNFNESSAKNKACDTQSSSAIKEDNNESKLDRDFINTVNNVSDFINYEKKYNNAERNQSIEILELHEKGQTELLGSSNAPTANINSNTEDLNSSDLKKSDNAPINSISNNKFIAHVAAVDSTKNYTSEVESSSKELNNTMKIVSAVANVSEVIEKVGKEIELEPSTKDVEEKVIKKSTNSINTSNNHIKEGQGEDGDSNTKVLQEGDNGDKLKDKKPAESEEDAMTNENLQNSSITHEDKLIEKLLIGEAKNFNDRKPTDIVNTVKAVTDFIDFEKRYNNFDKNSRNKRSTSVENVENIEVENTPIINEPINSVKDNTESDIPYEKLEKTCIKKSVSLTYLADVENDAASSPSAVDDVIVESGSKNNSSEKSNDSSEVEASFEDTLNSMTGKLREADVIIERMQHRRASETRINSIEEKLVKEASFDEPVIRTMQEELQERGLSGETEDEEIIMSRLQREDTRESSAQSDSVIFGEEDNVNVDGQEEGEDFEETAIVKASLKRLYTIAAGEDPKTLFKSVTIDDDIKYIEPSSEIETSATSGSSFCLDDDTSENIRQKMMAYSLSEADSDYFDASKTKANSSAGISIDKPKLNPDDFNISTALVDAADTSTETESTIVSAATKIQAGARGFLTRKRLRRASAGTKSSFPDESKASFGNDAISESLERLVEDEAAKKIQKAYRKHYREQRAIAHSEGSASAFDHGTPLAARRLTLQRGDAMRNDSTPDEENGSTSNSSSSEKGKILKNANAEEKSGANYLVSIPSTITSKTTTAATTSDRAKIIMENKLKWLSLRQNSMPVQIDDSEVFRIIPKHMRKRIKSAEGDKKIRRRILKD